MGEKNERGPMSEGDLANLETWARDCRDAGEGWRWGNFAPPGGFATIDEAVVEYEAYVRNVVDGVPEGEPLPAHALEMWGVWIEGADGKPLAVAITGNGPTSARHARALAVMPKCVLGLVAEVRRLRRAAALGNGRKA